MVNLIYGKKGSGKTKRLIDMTNAELSETKGNVAFIDDDKRYMYDIKPMVRFVDTTEYAIDSSEKLYGLLCGMMAQDYDLSAIYIDAFLKIIGKTPLEAETVIKSLEAIAEKHNVKIVINMSGDPGEATEYLKGLMI